VAAQEATHSRNYKVLLTTRRGAYFTLCFAPHIAHFFSLDASLMARRCWHNLFASFNTRLPQQQSSLMCIELGHIFHLKNLKQPWDSLPCRFLIQLTAFFINESNRGSFRLHLNTYILEAALSHVSTVMTASKIIIFISGSI
jgi:hypothetical protein